MNIVLDTNVFVSGIFFSGPPSDILKAWGKGKIQIILSQGILDEYHRVAHELSVKFPSIDIAPIIEFVTIHGTFVDTQDVEISVCEDPDDDKFIECAVAGDCKIIVSGDKHLLKLTGYKGITVLSPRAFKESYIFHSKF
ncbi:MAG: putative toxin-antitoxin system toxin component, PIN family [Desulfobacteraceae bacterium]|jgi:putative PIN family toxin of toxin-antitoxin system